MATSSGSGNIAQYNNLSIGKFVSSLGTGFFTFVGLIALFYILKLYFPRVYRPKTYLVPPKDRTKPPPPGLWRWVIPIFNTKNSEFIQKCGLDAYFFLRYLRMLLKLFVPLACIVLPILLPINATGGNNTAGGYNSNYGNNTATVGGMNVLAWSNVSVDKHQRFWAHLVLAICIVIYVCYLAFYELRAYVRIRQAFLTSPQHRLRASATTVLVKAIPDKWNSAEALEGLFDVYPGGVRNVWINRDFQALSDKVKRRDELAKKLESAEMNLVKLCKEKHDAAEKKKAKAEKKQNKSSAEIKKQEIDKDGAAEAMAAAGEGISTGNPHQVHTLRQFFHGNDSGSNSQQDDDEEDEDFPKKKAAFGGLGVVGEEIGGAVGTGLKGVTRFGNQGLREAKGFGDKGFGALTSGVTKVGGLVRFGSSRHAPQQEPTPGTSDGADESANAADTPKTPGSPLDTQEKRDEKILATDDLDLATATHWTFWKKTEKFHGPTPTINRHDDAPAEESHTSASGSPREEKHTASEQDTSDEISRSGSQAQADQTPSKTAKAKAKKVKFTKVYPAAYDEEFADAGETEAAWQKYIKPGDRDTMRLEIFGWMWMFRFPGWMFIGKKVDTIYYCRKEVARLNLEIETDQKEPEKYPLMNSAFIQFNHQVAAHMACQSAAHHLPQQMSPRIVEIAPDDVIWDNMAIRWWESYIRQFGIILAIAAAIIFWAVPSAFVGGLSHLDSLVKVPGLEWVAHISKGGQSFLQGVIPALLTSLMFFLVPILLQFLHRLTGVSTGNQVQQATQMSYFAFLFVNLFLVVTIAASISTVVTTLTDNLANPAKIPGFLAKNLPGASIYFFNYMILQSLSTSSGALAQVLSLVVLGIIAPLNDSTPRQKWRRRVNLSTLNWGTFFPPYTNFACIGLVYSVIAPLIVVFNIVMFSLFWVAYRYNTLYVNKYRFDTGGLLFPTAINQLFTGLYVMIICLIGLFFLVEAPDPTGGPGATMVVCKAQGIIMIVVGLLTILYQVLLNYAFGPLLTYLPITLEDEAVMRDEAFARAQDSKWGAHDDENEQRGNGNDVELEQLSDRSTNAMVRDAQGHASHGSWSSGRHSRSNDFGRETVDLNEGPPSSPKQSWRTKKKHINNMDKILHPPESRKGRQDVEAQQTTIRDEDFLFGNFSDTIEDLTPEERDALVDRAFKHSALRARRPCIWIPRDELGVSDDEIRQTDKLTDWIWISNQGAALNSKGQCVFRKSPPDFSDIDLVEL